MLRRDCSVWPPGGGPAQGPRGRGRGLPGDKANLTQGQGWGRSVGTVPIWAAVRGGREQGSPAGALDPAGGHQQPPLQHSCGQGGDRSENGSEAREGQGWAGLGG